MDSFELNFESYSFPVFIGFFFKRAFDLLLAKFYTLGLGIPDTIFAWFKVLAVLAPDWNGDLLRDFFLSVMAPSWFYRYILASSFMELEFPSKFKFREFSCANLWQIWKSVFSQSWAWVYCFYLMTSDILTLVFLFIYKIISSIF